MNVGLKYKNKVEYNKQKLLKNKFHNNMIKKKNLWEPKLLQIFFNNSISAVMYITKICETDCKLGGFVDLFIDCLIIVMHINIYLPSLPLMDDISYYSQKSSVE